VLSSIADVLLPTLTTWGAVCQEVQDPVAEGVFSPMVISLVMNFVGTMVLDAEL
jgi:hypothetical protein